MSEKGAQEAPGALRNTGEAGPAGRLSRGCGGLLGALPGSLTRGVGTNEAGGGVRTPWRLPFWQSPAGCRVPPAVPDTQSASPAVPVLVFGFGDTSGRGDGPSPDRAPSL